MKIIFENSNCKAPKVSFILLDWSCRESFHTLDYLNQQSVPRDQFEIIWIEYYSRRSPEIEAKIKNNLGKGLPPVVDQWIVINTPEDTYYHKHLMYNVGVVHSRGRIACIADSDGIVKPTFVESIIKVFNENSNIVLHMDEVRNTDQRFHPFNYPSFEDILGKGCTNFKGGKTTGLWHDEDPLHSRNYGACMCALRKDMIAIGGADEHLDYLGHVCGPYELTFRLVNAGKTEIWHQEEFLYHVWHPGTDGIDNYIGPHDGRHMSSTALETIKSRRILPLLENEAIFRLRKQEEPDEASILQHLIPVDWKEKWSIDAIKSSSSFYKMESYSSWKEHGKKSEQPGSPAEKAPPRLLTEWYRYNMVLFGGRVYSVPQRLGELDLSDPYLQINPEIIVTGSVLMAKLKILVTLFKEKILNQQNDTSG